MSWCWGGCPRTQQDAVAPGRMLSRLGWFHHIWEDTWEDARAAGRMPARLLSELLQINTRNKKNPPALPTPAHRLLQPVRSRSRPRSPPAASSRSLRHPLAAAGGSAKPPGGQQKALQGLIPPAVAPLKAPRVPQASLAHAAEAQRVKSHRHPGTSPLRNRLSARRVSHAGDYGPGCPR